MGKYLKEIRDKILILDEYMERYQKEIIGLTEENKKLKKEFKRLKEENKKLKEWYIELEEDMDEVEKENNNLKYQNEQLQEENKKLKGDSKMRKVFISQPMRGLSDEEIIKERKRIKEKIESTIGEDVAILDSYFKDYKPVGNSPVAYLGKSIELLAQADILYSGKGWSKARGCIIENKIAKDYEIEIIYEDSKEEIENISNFKEEIERLREENNNLKYENNQWEEENEKLINNILRLEDCIDNIYVHLTLLEDNEVEFDISAASDDVSNIIKEYYPKYFN